MAVVDRISSTIIEHIRSIYESDPAVAIAYFYFDFNDNEKQQHEKYLRSLIEQLSVQSVKSMDALNTLFACSKDGQQQPTTDALLSTLQHILGDFQQTFIILDTLDECKEREALLKLLENSTDWNVENLHILATSRRERDIEDTLAPLATDQICIQSALVNADIHVHLCDRLQNDPKLNKWPANVQREIEKTLMDGAHGMYVITLHLLYRSQNALTIFLRFRWVVCQLDVLSKCLKLNALRKALQSLPKTLDDTYARILCSIDEEYSQDAFTILQWLVYSARPLRIEEVAEVVAIDIDLQRFDAENRLRERRDILTICSSLVTTAAVTAKGGNGVSYETEELRLAHFSVKEYLISDRVRTGPASKYNIQGCAEDRIAQACLIYLLQFEGSTLLTPNDIDDFPLARYAAEHWTRHARAATQDADRVNQLSIRLFHSERDVYLNWIRLSNPDMPGIGFDMTQSTINVASPLYYASLESLVKPVARLLEKGGVNAQGGRYGNALQAASRRGNEAIVRLLLEKGANVNAQGGEYGNALCAASSGGYIAIVALLLKKGAEINTEDRHYGNPLQEASGRGHENVVALLLENGANVNAQGGPIYNSALQAASGGGHKAIVTLLLEKGANVNVQGGLLYNNALQVASHYGYEAIVTVLLEKGADVNAYHGRYGSALLAASYMGHTTIVALLLEKGANINIEDSHYGNALQAASDRGNMAIVALLLEKGVDINAHGGFYGNTLQVAALRGNMAIVALLLENGADINAHGGYYGNALQAAAYRGNMAIIALLLEKGVGVNAQGGHYGNALQAASCGENEAIIRLLLEKGANVNAQGGHYGNALQAASGEGHQDIAMLLLNQGADINAQGGYYGNALRAASRKCHEFVVWFLLENGADVDSQGNGYGNMFQAASHKEREEIVCGLLSQERFDD
jgi:ankyrin repeat protein